MNKPTSNPSSAAITALPSLTTAWYTTGLLALLYWLSVLDRYVISLLVDPIKHDLGLTDIQFGMLHGMAFAVTFSVFGLMAGVLADRFSRRWIIFVSVSVWSTATAACGLVAQFWQLLLARVGVGAGEAGLNPCATSMISDLFPRDRLTTAMAVYAIGSTIGSGCAYLFGGYIVELVARSGDLVFPLIGEVRSWQAVFLIVGLPGVLFALLIFTTPEPKRQLNTGNTSSGKSGFFSAYPSLFKFMRSRGRFFTFHYLGFGTASVITIGSGAWYPAHMGRIFGWSAGEIGLSLGLVLIISSTIGKLVCGYCVDWLYRAGFRDAQFRWYAGALMVATPCGIIATTSTEPWVFLIGIGFFLALISSLPAVSNAALNLVTPTHLRGVGVAFYSSSSGLVGMSLGPILAALASKVFFNDESIGHGIAVLTAICCPLAAVFLLLGRSAMSRAVTQAETNA